ncbi:MAG: bleomycin resistance family protein [Candidatus Gracilibacteria bacterium]|nr:bleomycin resistance family protein [Candidatus Gracilibacteria bacterium]
MKINAITPNMMVKDVAKTVQYYTEVLGFTCFMLVDFDKKADFDGLHDGVEYAFAILKFDDVELIIQAEKNLAGDLPFLGTAYADSSIALYIRMQGVEELYKKIKDNVTIKKDIENSWYGMREFYIHDCNGYVLGFAEMMEGGIS